MTQRGPSDILSSLVSTVSEATGLVKKGTKLRGEELRNLVSQKNKAQRYLNQLKSEVKGAGTGVTKTFAPQIKAQEAKVNKLSTDIVRLKATPVGKKVPQAKGGRAKGGLIKNSRKKK